MPNEIYGIWRGDRWWVGLDRVVWATPYRALAEAQLAYMSGVGGNILKGATVRAMREDGTPVLRQSKAKADDAG